MKYRIVETLRGFSIRVESFGGYWLPILSTYASQAAAEDALNAWRWGSHTVVAEGVV